jgi:hypothetical protein
MWRIEKVALDYAVGAASTIQSRTTYHKTFGVISVMRRQGSRLHLRHRCKPPPPPLRPGASSPLPHCDCSRRRLRQSAVNGHHLTVRPIRQGSCSSQCMTYFSAKQAIKN